jgi:hypothetical protein
MAFLKHNSSPVPPPPESPDRGRYIMPIALKYLPSPLTGEGVCTSPSPRIARHAGAASTPPAHYPTITDVVKMGWPRCIVFA